MNKSTKKSIIILSITVILSIAVTLILWARKASSFDYDSNQFAVKDTNTITKIFIADFYENTVLLERQTNGVWKVNKKFVAVQQNVNDLLNIVSNISIREPVALAARNNVTKWLATGSNKVEIYYKEYKIKIGNLKLWKYQAKKVYYIGNVTQDNLGNYAVMEGGKDPFIVNLPGFRGFISPYYSPFESEWKSHSIIKLKISRIAKVEIIDYEHPEQSFSIVRNGIRTFDILTKENIKLPVYDTAKLFDHLSEYRDLNFEFYAVDLTKGSKDSILSMKFKDIVITDNDNKQTKISMYYMKNELDTANYIYNEDFIDIFNRDKFYAVINDKKEELVICQYFVFDRIIQPLAYYLPFNEVSK